MKNFSNMLNKESIRNLIKEVITNKVYNDIDIPIPLENNYFINNNYGLLLIMDALIKYDIIIEDNEYLSSFVEDLRLIIKKMFITYQPPCPQSWGIKVFLVIWKLLAMRVISYIIKLL